MNPNDRDIALLNEIIDLLQLTIGHVSKNKEAFISNLDMRDAAALRVQTIGEYMRSLSESFREEHPDLPWRQAIAMRNIIAHEYGKIDYVILWEAITGHDFQSFLEKVQAILKQ